MKRILFLLAALPFLLNSCKKDDNGTDPDTGGKTGGGDIVFAIGIGEQVQTKVTTGADFKSEFEEGDEIGIYAVRHASGTTGTALELVASGNYIHNVKLTYSTADGGKWTAENSLWHATGSDVLDFYAYYPYDAAASNPTNITFNVLADQSTALNYSKSDLLSAKLAGVAKSTTPVTLTFAHKLSLVEVEVDPTYIDRNATFTATLNNCKAGGAFNLSNSSLTPTGNAQSVKMFRVEKSTDDNYKTKYTYRALVPAQSVASGTNLCLMAQNGQLYNTPTLTTDLALTAGDAKRYTAKLPATALQTVKILKGNFQMGEAGWAEPVHQVTLTKDFYMSKYEITNAQYAAFLNANSIGSDGKGMVEYYKNGFTNTVTETKIFIDTDIWGVEWDTDKWIPATGKDNFPIINVSWYGAKAYADWIGGSLPTEAQWEYACRAGTTTPYSFGDNIIDKYAWYDVNSSSTIHEVGTRQPNAWGLYDMHGNVWEWCSDWFSTYTATATDPTGGASNPTDDSFGCGRVFRGGCYLYDAQFCLSAFRNFFGVGFASGVVGFRVVVP